MMKEIEKNYECEKQCKKCKYCKIEECKELIKILEEKEKKNLDIRIKNIKKQLPTECQECNMYEVIDIRKQKVYCPYMIGNSCVIK